MSEVVDRFLKAYQRNRDFFERAAAICHEQCREVLLQNGIQHLVTYRAKRQGRLRDKLEQHKLEGRTYATEEALLEGVSDLAGVRVALYFPGDRPEATRLLSGQFDLVAEPKHFTGSEERRGAEIYTYRYPGYSASHLRVKLRPDSLNEDQQHYAESRIEIQIASLVMHAWAEVEHDLVYKPFQGELSETEYALLDQANGLAYAGEIALEQLQVAMRNRLARGQAPFRNHYEVASLIHTALELPESGDFRIGRADLLLRLLRQERIARPDRLVEFLKFEPELGAASSVVDQVVMRIADSQPARRELVRESWKALLAAEAQADEQEDSGYERAVVEAFETRETFKARWRTLEQTLKGLLACLDEEGRSRAWLDLGEVERIAGLSATNARRVREAQNEFLRLAHGDSATSDEALAQLSDDIGEITEWLYSEFPEVRQ